MKCPHCGRTDHEPGAKFCENCGYSLAHTNTQSVRNELPKTQLHGKDPIINDIPQKTDRPQYTINPNPTSQRRIKSGIFNIIFILLVLLFAGYGIYYGISNCGTFHSVEYIDKVSLEAWKNRRLDPNKWDYLLNGEPEPEPITGTLIVDSSPQGADIILDGKKTGLTSPATIEGITEGEHKVTVKMKNIKITNTWYNIGDNDYSIMFTFEEPYIPIVKR